MKVLPADAICAKGGALTCQDALANTNLLQASHEILGAQRFEVKHVGNLVGAEMCTC